MVALGYEAHGIGLFCDVFNLLVRSTQLSEQNVAFDRLVE
jgi:hypothetical protein